MFKTHRTFTLETGVKNNSIAVIGHGESIDVVYHKTIVVSKRGRNVTLSNGSWDTVSTRAVINRALEQMALSECYLYRKKNQTFITQNGVIKPFVSGMKIRVRS